VTKLNPEPARKDLTVRECTKLIGSTIGGLCSMTDKATLAKAVAWWAENFDTSGVFELTERMEKGIGKPA
jgi:hypothetical protein